jgi:acetyl-CoA carboxylase carboxyltransferase component
MAALGGPEPHARKAGVVHVVTPSDGAAIARARELAVLLGAQGLVEETMLELDALAEEVTRRKPGDHPALPSLAGFLPASPRRAYDVKPLIGALLDAPGVELHPHWAPNVVTLLGRLAGRTVGVIASNPLRRGGCLDATSAEKPARFVRMCDAFGVPLVVLVDVPGYLPGVGQKWDGVVRRGAKLLHAFAEASVPCVTLVTRKAYGGAYIAMNSRALGPRRCSPGRAPRSRSWARSRPSASCTAAPWPTCRRTSSPKPRPLSPRGTSARRAAWTAPVPSAWWMRSSSLPRPGKPSPAPSPRPGPPRLPRQHPAVSERDS